MAKKYVQDYRLENRVGRDGKLRTVPVYKGDWFDFTADPASVARAKTTYPALIAASGVLLLYLLIFTNHMDNQWYVVLPAAFSLIFWLFAALSVYRLLRAKGPVTREHKDKLYDRMAPMSLIFTILLGLCSVGSVVGLILLGVTWQRVVYLIAALLCTVFGLLMFLGRKVLRMEKTDKAPAQA